MRTKPGEHNEADLGTKMVDLRIDLTLKREHFIRPSEGCSSWMVAATVPTVAEAAKNCRVLIWNDHEVSGWFWICMGIVIVFLMVLSGDCRRWKVTDAQTLHCGVHTFDRARALSERRVLKSGHFIPNETLVQLVRSAVMRIARNAWTAAWFQLICVEQKFDRAW